MASGRVKTNILSSCAGGTPYQAALLLPSMSTSLVITSHWPHRWRRVRVPTGEARGTRTCRSARPSPHSPKPDRARRLAALTVRNRGLLACHWEFRPRSWYRPMVGRWLTTGHRDQRVPDGRWHRSSCPTIGPIALIGGPHRRGNGNDRLTGESGRSRGVVTEGPRHPRGLETPGTGTTGERQCVGQSPWPCSSVSSPGLGAWCRAAPSIISATKPRKLQATHLR